MQDALFISHGSPMTALDGGAAGAFMRGLGPQIDATFGRPRAILGISAHSLAPSLTLLAGPHHEAVYDFGGFDPLLRTLRYDAPGAPKVAESVSRRLQDQGWTVRRLPASGLDHGLWTPLRHAWPRADIPVLPLAWNPHTPPAELMRLGRDLAPLVESGVLLMASGSITHNLQLFMADPQPEDAPERPESTAFRDWWCEKTETGRWDDLAAYRSGAPHGPLMHPTDEHLLPFFVTAGVAQGLGAGLRRLHASAQHGVIGMDAYGLRLN